jgi:hypothetical protein
LCFEAIQKYLIPTDNGVDSYFLNFSDGQPAYSINTKDDIISYSGDAAAEHQEVVHSGCSAYGLGCAHHIVDQPGGPQARGQREQRRARQRRHRSERVRIDALDVLDLDPRTINDTLGVLLKYQDDIQRLQGSEAAEILRKVKSDIAAQPLG